MGGYAVRLQREQELAKQLGVPAGTAYQVEYYGGPGGTLIPIGIKGYGDIGAEKIAQIQKYRGGISPPQEQKPYTEEQLTKLGEAQKTGAKLEFTPTGIEVSYPTSKITQPSQLVWRNIFTGEYAPVSSAKAPSFGYEPVMVSPEGEFKKGFISPFGGQFIERKEPKQITETFISTYSTMTGETIKERQYYEEFYGKGFDLLQPIKEFISERLPIRKEEDTQFKLVSFGMDFGTAQYRQKTEKELTTEQKYFKEYYSIEPFQISFLETRLKEKREDILGGISIGGITLLESTLGNIELQQYYEKETGKYLTGFEEREKARQEKYFPQPKPSWLGEKISKILPEIEWQPEAKAEEIWGRLPESLGGTRKKIAVGYTSAITFGMGIYKEVRRVPEKAVIEYASWALIPPAFKIAKEVTGIGKIGAELASAYPRTSAFFGKGIRYGFNIAYGTSIGLRVAMAGGLYKGIETAGGILATETTPMYLGLKTGTYYVGRYEQKARLKDIVSMMPPKKQAEFWAEMKEARALYKVEPVVKEMSLERLKQLEKYPKTQQKLISYFRQKGLIVGGSIGQQTQMELGIKTKRPADIDLYAKSFNQGMEEIRARTSAKEIAGILRGEKIKGVGISGTEIKIGGKKFLEVHPYSTYLKANIEQVVPYYRTAKFGLTETPSGIKVMTLQTQLQRKIYGGYLEKYETGKLRLKDIPAAEAIRKSLYVTGAKQTVGIENIKESRIIESDVSVFGRTWQEFRFGGLIRQPTDILIKKGLLPAQKTVVLRHELIHALHPWWGEEKVSMIHRLQAGKVGLELETFQPKGLKTIGASYFRGGLSGVSQRYSPYQPSRYPSFIPYRPSPLYKPSMIPYKPMVFYKPQIPYKPVSSYRLQIPYTKTIYQPSRYPSFIPYRPSPYKPSAYPYQPISPKQPTFPYTPYEPKYPRLPPYKPRIELFKLPRYGERVKPVRIGYKTGHRYQPSLTASILSIRGKAPYGKSMGLIPLQLRGLPSLSRRIKRKKHFNILK